MHVERRRLRLTRGLLIATAAIAALLTSFGIALAAVVQVSREVPASVNFEPVQVLPDDQLVVSYDPAGFDPVNELQIELVAFEPPLEFLSGWYQDVYVRSDSEQPLMLVAPCSDALDDGSNRNLGHFSIHDPETHQSR